VQTLKTLPFKAFGLVVKPFIGTGIGRFRPVGAIYRYLTGALIMPVEKRLVSVNSYKMFVHTEKNRGTDGITLQLLFKGTYEQYTTALFKQLIKTGMTVVDIGANIGYFTLLAASLVGEKGKVFAFEPEPSNYALLVENIEVNGYKNIIPLQKAVSNEAGKVKLFVDTVTSGEHSLFKAAVERETKNFAEAITVDVVSLDEFLKDNECAIDVIKMDIQGAEMMALLGMAKTIENNNDLQIFTEYWPYGLQKSGFSPQEYWNKLMQFGFKFIYSINEHKQELEIVDSQAMINHCKDTVLKQFDHMNLLCSRYPISR
jgi:FkbM family methyltransferase